VLEQGIGAGASVFDVQVEVIQAAQREIGRLWQENQISIAEEHMAPPSRTRHWPTCAIMPLAASPTASA
jgi:hypothetical protein